MVDSDEYNRPTTYTARPAVPHSLAIVTVFDSFHTSLQKAEVAKPIREDEEKPTKGKVLKVVMTEKAMAMRKTEKQVFKDLDFHIAGSNSTRS